MYRIKGKIDSTNAAEFEKELMAAKPAELDASELEYISSAGLRVLLKLAKAVGDVTVNNVSSEVYEIFGCYRLYGDTECKEGYEKGIRKRAGKDR